MRTRSLNWNRIIDPEHSYDNPIDKLAKAYNVNRVNLETPRYSTSLEKYHTIRNSRKTILQFLLTYLTTIIDH